MFSDSSVSLFGNLFGKPAGTEGDSRLFNPVYKKGLTDENNLEESEEKETKKPKKDKKKKKASEEIKPSKKSKIQKTEEEEEEELDSPVEKTTSKSKKRRQEIEDEQLAKSEDVEDENNEEEKKRKKRKRDAVQIESEDEEEEFSKTRAPKKEKEAPSDSTPADDEQKLKRTLFVGNLSTSTSTKQIKKLFSRYGEVESLRVRSVPVNQSEESKGTRRSKVIKQDLNAEEDHLNMFLVFKTEEGATAALAHNMQEMEGRHLRVDRAARPSDGSGSEVEYDRTRSVFLGNLHFTTTEEEVIRHFQGSAACSMYPALQQGVEAVRLVRDRETNKSKGVGFVLFKTKEAARAALNLHEDVLKDREIRVTRVAAKSGGAKTPTGSKFGGQARFQSNKKGFTPSKKGGSVSNTTSPKSASGASWQGQKAKRKTVEKSNKSPGGKDSSRGKVGGSQTGASFSSGKKPAPKDKSRKRPSVEARKKLQLHKKKK